MWEEVYNVCEKVYGAREVRPGGVRTLQTFKGYTVDFRLKEFRIFPTKGPPEFIDFRSNEGAALVDEMFDKAISNLQTSRYYLTKEEEHMVRLRWTVWRIDDMTIRKIKAYASMNGIEIGEAITKLVDIALVNDPSK